MLTAIARRWPWQVRWKSSGDLQSNVTANHPSPTTLKPTGQDRRICTGMHKACISMHCHAISSHDARHDGCFSRGSSEGFIVPPPLLYPPNQMGQILHWHRTYSTLLPWIFETTTTQREGPNMNFIWVFQTQFLLSYRANSGSGASGKMTCIGASCMHKHARPFQSPSRLKQCRTMHSHAHQPNPLPPTPSASGVLRIRYIGLRSPPHHGR